MASLGHIEEFVPNRDSWSMYTERLDFYFQANEITDSAVKRAVLFSVCGPAAYATIRSLSSPKKPSEIAYAEILKIASAHFNPKPSEIVQRFQFHKRDQHTGEKVSSYVAELRSLAEFCNFGTSLDSMLRDRLVCGVQDEALQRKLLAETDLTFDKALKAALAAEAAKYQTQELRAATNNDTIHKVGTNTKYKHYKYNKNKEEHKPCFRCCGEHKPDSCKFADEKCRYCGKQGHIERACYSKKKANMQTQKSSKNRQRSTHTNSLTFVEEPESSNFYELKHIHSTSGRECQSNIVLVELNGIPHNMELDSGAVCLIISLDTYHNLWPEGGPQIVKNGENLRTWSQEEVDVIGVCHVNVKYQQHNCQLPLYVAKIGGNSLLGRPWWQPLGFRVEGIHSCSTSNNDIIKQLIGKYEEVFSEDISRYKGPPVSIETNPDVTPVFLKCRPVPFAPRGKLDKELDLLVAQKVFEPVRHSNWATPIVIVPKANGQLRVCGDYKSTVNKAAKTDIYPLPTVNEILQTLSGGVVFSKLDLAQAYQQLKVDDATAQLQTLNTPKGLMRVTRLQFGINAAAGIFQRFIETCLAGIEGVKPYLDDIYISGTSDVQHLQRLEAVLRRLQDVGIRLKKEKCKFGVSELEVLGFKVDRKGIRPTEEKVEAIQKAPRPTNKTELQGFLGLLNFYNCFLKDKASILEPLHRLLDKDSEWRWGRAHETAFNQAKQLLKSPSVLIHYNPRLPLGVVCDASSYGVGAVLFHTLEDGSEAPIAYASRTMSKAERNYAQVDKEALAVIFAIKKFHQYLYGRRFKIFSDHKPLLGLLRHDRAMPGIMSPRMIRWSLLLSAYDYELFYRSGKQIGNADGLSRLPKMEPEVKEGYLGDILLLEALHNPPIDAQQIAKDTRSDKWLSRVLNWVLSGWPDSPIEEDELKPFSRRRDELSTHRGCLLWGNRVVVPLKLRKKVLELLHEAHPGVVRMKALARGYVWWPGLDEEVEEVVRSCNVCQESRHAPPKVTEKKWARASRPWSRLHLDFAGPFQGNIFLIVVDAYSKWLEVVRMASMTSTAVVDELAKLFATHGLPETIVTDNGRSFVSMEFQEFMRANAIAHIKTAAYHPSSNGMAERMVGVTKDSLRKIIHGSWSNRLFKFLFNQHITPNPTTGISPAEALLNRRPRSLLDNLHPDRHDMSRTQQQNEAAAFQSNFRVFRQDDEVYMRSFQSNSPKWVPATVRKPVGSVMYEVQERDGQRHRRHTDQLRLKRSSLVTPVNASPPPAAAGEENRPVAVEAVPTEPIMVETAIPPVGPIRSPGTPTSGRPARQRRPPQRLVYE